MSVLDDKLDFFTNITTYEKEHYSSFEHKINNINDAIVTLLEDGFKSNRFVFSGTINLNNDDELQMLSDKNKQLRHDISVRMSEVENSQTKYETFKKDQKLLSQEIKDTHEAFLMAKKFYKKYLKMYYTIETKNNAKQTIFVQFFTESKKESENYSARLLRDTKSGVYELLSTTPKLQLQKELQRRLQDTNDVPELLCCLRQAFLVMKTSKTK